MDRPKGFEEHRYLGDKRTMRVHDLDRATDRCGVDEIMRNESFLAFAPDTLPEARNRSYRSCRHCRTDEEDDA